MFFCFLVLSNIYKLIFSPLSAVSVPVPVQENPVSEQSTPSAEEAVSGEVYNPPENGDVPVTEEEEVPVPEVVDEVQDNAEPVVESPAKVDDAPKKSYASIVSGLSPVGKLNPMFSILVARISYFTLDNPLLFSFD